MTPGIRATVATTAFGERRRPDERARRPGLDDVRVETQCVDGVVGLHTKPVGEAGEDEGHREHQAGADDCDHEAPSSPLEVAQRHTQHGLTLPTFTQFSPDVCLMDMKVTKTTVDYRLS